VRERERKRVRERERERERVGERESEKVGEGIIVRWTKERTRTKLHT
jgi:hypothetical protein